MSHAHADSVYYRKYSPLHGLKNYIDLQHWIKVDLNRST